jgi:hypothetical protein
MFESCRPDQVFIKSPCPGQGLLFFAAIVRRTRKHTRKACSIRAGPELVAADSLLHQLDRAPRLKQFADLAVGETGFA